MKQVIRIAVLILGLAATYASTAGPQTAADGGRGNSTSKPPAAVNV
jgi:hypothetical protein